MTQKEKNAKRKRMLSLQRYLQVQAIEKATKLQFREMKRNLKKDGKKTEEPLVVTEADLSDHVHSEHCAHDHKE
jgi:predicted HAD superfamily phosphohydrolase YqeG